MPQWVLHHIVSLAGALHVPSGQAGALLLDALANVLCQLGADTRYGSDASAAPFRCLQARGMRAGELLLSTCSYHSPMHLICGDFQLCFPGHALRLGRSGRRGREQGQAQAQQAEQAAGRRGAAAPASAVTCRRGFDTAAGEVVPLRRALEGFRAA